MNASKNISASVKARLQNVAATRGEDFNLLLLRYGIERLLFRLSQSPHVDRFLLKGAMLCVVGDFMDGAPRCADFLFGKKMCGKRGGLLFSAFFTRKIFHAEDRRDYELGKSGFLHGRGPDARTAGKMIRPRSSQKITK